MDCPVCYLKTDYFIINCNHALSYDCYCKLEEKKCPICREKIKGLEDINKHKNKVSVYFSQKYDYFNKFIFLRNLKRYVFSKGYKSYLERVLSERNFKYYKLEENQIILSRDYLFTLDENLTKQEYFLSILGEFRYHFFGLCESIIKKIISSKKILINSEIIVINCIKKFGVGEVDLNTFGYSSRNELVINFFIVNNLLE